MPASFFPPSDGTVPPEDSSCVAILTAAGSGTRLGSAQPKALVKAAGESLLRRSARALAESAVVDQIVVTAPEEHLATFAQELADLDTDVEISVVAGSPQSRQASVQRGLDAALSVRPDAAVILVHDAARAFTPPAVISRVVAAVRSGYDAVVPAVAVTDTVKEVAPSADSDVELVTGTPERARLRAVQTPQGFTTAVLQAAHRAGAQRANTEALAASDDAALVEANGGQVAVVPGDALAFKVTTALDLALAELIGS